MAAGFRRSLMGFNREDVLNYLSAEDKKNNQIINGLKEEIDGLSKQNSDYLKKLDEMEAQLSVYKEKEEQIERLSHGIGTLYMLAKSNADIIMNNAEAGKKAAKTEINNNLLLLEAVQNNLATIKQDLDSLNKNFDEGVSALESSVASTKDEIKQNLSKADAAHQSFTEAVQK